MMDTMQQAVTSDVRIILRKIASAAEPVDAGVLSQQVDSVEVTGGKITMLDLAVGTDVPRLDRPDGPLTGRAFVVDSRDSDVGELIVWIAGGYISALEYAWWTDDAPTELPRARQLRVASG